MILLTIPNNVGHMPDVLSLNKREYNSKDDCWEPEYIAESGWQLRYTDGWNCPNFYNANHPLEKDPFSHINKVDYSVFL